MWAKIASIILRNRLRFLIAMGLITLFMGYNASFVSITYEFAKLLPDDDSTYVSHVDFKKRFGEDGTVMVIGMQDSTFFTLPKYNAWYDLTQEIKAMDGIKEVLSVTRMFNLVRNDSLQKFEFKPILAGRASSQEQLDSIKDVIYDTPFYKGFIYDQEQNSSLMAITFDKDKLNSKARLGIVNRIKEIGDAFQENNKIELHYSGLPYIRSVIAQKVASEMVLFMMLALVVTAIILFVFFKSIQTVLFSLIVVIIGVVWSFGTIYLMGYKITVLSGLIPPLIIVIGVPNCILLLNKYHVEYSKYGNKIRALTRMIEKIGVSLFFANVTTSIGFFVFVFTHSKILVEFGLVAAMNVMGTYLISMISVPIVFSYLPPPKQKHTKHIEGSKITGVLAWIDNVVHHKRRIVYSVVIVVTIISFYGLSKITPLGYVVDDLPSKDPVYVDLRFFERIYHGVLPFEVSIDTKKEKGVFKPQTLYKINRLQKLLITYPELSKPVSVVEGIKFSNQAYNDNKRKYYILPGGSDLQKLSDYAGEAKNNKYQSQLSSFIDSTKRYTRVSVQMADIGSEKMKDLVKDISPRIDSIFNYDSETKQWALGDDRYKVTLTGNSLMFLKGNDYLIKNLIESVGIAIVLITLVMLTLFYSFRMVVISVVPSLIPLIITAGLMGYFNIHLKPSTILIFSIAFGIASDGTLYFLTRYRQEMKLNPSITQAVSITIRETGISMIYTAVILACGFSIFTASTFGGTAALGLLVSVTLLFAYASNLILLPSFLMSLERYITRKAIIQEPFIQLLDEEEDINLDELTIESNENKEHS